VSQRVVPTVGLVPFTRGDEYAFIGAETADYAAWLVDRGQAADLTAALARACAEVEPEVKAALRAGEQFWAAHNAQGATVGWLWVKPSMAGLPPEAAFLYQILVKPESRCQGYGIAMLSVLEDVLAAAGRGELRLNVWDSNVAGQRLYDRAGYELVELLPSKRQLRKRLGTAHRTLG
jgi:ribosomal protein S18 acetylase RimI-like enzyme